MLCERDSQVPSLLTYRVRSGSFVALFVAEERPAGFVVLRASPELHVLVGQSLTWALEYCLRQSWEVETI